MMPLVDVLGRRPALGARCDECGEAATICYVDLVPDPETGYQGVEDYCAEHDPWNLVVEGEA